MTQISKNKLRRLPYDARLNLIKHQSDFLSEVVFLINEYPEREHPQAEQLIIDKGTIWDVLSLMVVKNVNLLHLSDGLCEKINKLNLFDNIPINFCIDTFKSIKYREEFSYIIKNLIETLIDLDEKHRSEDYWWAGRGDQMPLELVTKLYESFYSYIDDNIITDYMLIYLNEEHVRDCINRIYGRTDSKKTREKIIDAINICDIIT